MEALDNFLHGFTSFYDKSQQVISFIADSTKISSNAFLAVSLSYFLKKNKNVILLSEVESLSHYATILRKFV